MLMIKDPSKIHHTIKMHSRCSMFSECLCKMVLLIVFDAIKSLLTTCRIYF